MLTAKNSTMKPKTNAPITLLQGSLLSPISEKMGNAGNLRLMPLFVKSLKYQKEINRLIIKGLDDFG